ncbi:hypothetical protein FER63_23395 [Salmonella enterica]|nr:hypothetical protein [Salmonella enterica]
MANTNVVTAENSAVKAEIQKVTTAVSASVTELGAIFIGLCERFTGKDSQSGDNFQHLLNGLEGSKGAKRFQSAIIARLNDFSEKTISIEYNEEKQTYSVTTLKGDDKKSLFKKDKFIAAVAAAKGAEFALNAPAKEAGEPKAKRFSAKTAEKKARESLLNLATGLLVSEGLTPEKLAIKLEAMLKEVLLDAKPAIEAEPEAPKS